MGMVAVDPQGQSDPAIFTQANSPLRQVHRNARPGLCRQAQRYLLSHPFQTQ
jgi:hypothetical protein